MKARNAWRGIPILLARSVISIRFSITTPSMTLWAIFEMPARPPPPTSDTPRGAIASSIGPTVLHAAPLPAQLRQRLGLGAGGVRDCEIVAGLEQALGHGQSHAAHPYPADLLFVCRHFNSPSSATRLRRSP